MIEFKPLEKTAKEPAAAEWAAADPKPEKEVTKPRVSRPAVAERTSSAPKVISWTGTELLTCICAQKARELNLNNQVVFLFHTRILQVQVQGDKSPDKPHRDLAKPGPDRSKAEADVPKGLKGKQTGIFSRLGLAIKQEDSSPHG